MAFRLPAHLSIARQFDIVAPGDVTAVEDSLPPRSRVLVGLVFENWYERLPLDCEQAEIALREAGIPSWPESELRVIPDQDGEPVVWVSYLSSPAWWTIILVVLGGVFFLPILGVLPIWIIDTIFPGAMETITMIGVMGLMAGMMKFTPNMADSPKETEKGKE